ncbi:hypothetical protein WJX72_007755 [[Myrmecia] bisecta]|uniref:RAP domain-containing protein n=1 Tax=[Myrmecia] bisecta TaxID=41462 RepID=A0AAW1Q9J2_9CHLO
MALVHAEDTTRAQDPGFLDQRKQFLDATARHILSLRGDDATLNAQYVTNVSWAYASLRHRHDALFGTMARYVGKKLADFPNQALSSWLWACAVLNHRPAHDVMQRAMKQYLDRLMQDIEPPTVSSICNFVWAVATLGAIRPSYLAAVAHQLAAQPDMVAKLRHQDLSSLHQALRICQLVYAGEDCSDVLPTGIQARIGHWLAVHADKVAKPSKFQMQVARAVKNMGIMNANVEFKTQDGGFSIDIAVTTDGAKLAIEADGPTHFTSNAPHEPLGHTITRNALLSAQGWQVVSIPFFEWDHKVGVELDVYLRDKIRSVLLAPGL